MSGLDLRTRDAMLSAVNVGFRRFPVHSRECRQAVIPDLNSPHLIIALGLAP
jgi:hypothetical protein